MDPELIQQDQQQQPEIPEPFTQADTLRLQQFNQGLSEAQKQVDDGTLAPEEGDALKQGILKMRMPLLARQEMSQKQAFQEQMKQQQQGSALAQGMQHADAVYRARGFNDRVSVYTDPLTGQSAHMYEHEPNKWKQIEFPEQAQAEGSQESAQTAYSPEAGAASETSQTNWGPEGQGGPPEDRGEPGVPPGTPGPETPPGPMGPARPNPDGTHTLDIWNGQSRESVQFDKQGKIIARQQFDRDGNPVQPPSNQATPGQVSQAELVEFRKRAEGSVQPIPKPSGGFRNMHEEVAYNNKVLERQKHVDNLVNHWSSQLQQQKNNQMSQGGRAEEHQRQEQVAKEKLETAKAAKDHEKATSDKYYKEYDQARKNLTTKDGPPPTHDAIEAERRKIEKHHDEYVGRRTGKTPAEAEKPALSKEQTDAIAAINAKAAGVKVPGEAPPATKPLPPEKPAHVPGGLHLLGVGQQPPGASLPTSITPERAGEVHGAMEEHLGKTGFLYPLSAEGAAVKSLKAILQKTSASGNPMTLGDRQRYERELARLSNEELRKKFSLEK